MAAFYLHHNIKLAKRKFGAAPRFGNKNITICDRLRGAPSEKLTFSVKARIRGWKCNLQIQIEGAALEPGRKRSQREAKGSLVGIFTKRHLQMPEGKNLSECVYQTNLYCITIDKQIPSLGGVCYIGSLSPEAVYGTSSGKWRRRGRNHQTRKHASCW